MHSSSYSHICGFVHIILTVVLRSLHMLVLMFILVVTCIVCIYLSIQLLRHRSVYCAVCTNIRTSCSRGFIHKSTCMRTYIHTYIHACMHKCIHAYIHAYRCIYRYRYACIPTHAHTDMYSVALGSKPPSECQGMMWAIAARFATMPVPSRVPWRLPDLGMSGFRAWGSDSGLPLRF